MSDRNLFYTAVSRAKKQVQIFDTSEGIDAALHTLQKPRRSMLVQKTRMLGVRAVG